MITRPLDLASRLRPAPRNFDALFYVNVGALALFFLVFGSRFVLAPGLGVDFRLPQMGGALAEATTATSYISIRSSDQIITDSGLLYAAQLPEWLKAEAMKDRRPVLLIEASEGVSISEIAKITSLAKAAGFVRVQEAAAEPAAPAAGMR